MNVRYFSHHKTITHSAVWLMLAALSFSSCIKDNTKQLEDQESQKIENYKIKNGFSDSDTLGTGGIYFKYIKEGSGITPVWGDYVIMSLTGKNTDGSVFQTTDSAIAKNAGFYRPDIIYGPARTAIGYNLLEGLRMVLMHMKEGSHAKAIVPSKYAYLDYEPVVYDLVLYRVIRQANIKQYEYDQAKSYAEAHSITDVYTNKTLQYPPLDSTFFRTIKEGTTAFNLVESDSVKITLYGYYAETDTAYITASQPRRTFFPINNSGTTHKFVFGETYFPISPAVDSVLLHMKIGGEMEMVVNSKYAFGSTGFLHPTVGAVIIPAYMSIHYHIKVDTMFHNAF